MAELSGRNPIYYLLSCISQVKTREMPPGVQGEWYAVEKIVLDPISILPMDKQTVPKIITEHDVALLKVMKLVYMENLGYVEKLRYICLKSG